MKFKIYAMRDRATDQYMNPLFLISKGQAIRHFGDEVNRADKDNPLYAHPEDYELYELGEYNTATGLFETGAPQQVAVAKDLAMKQQ